MAHIATKKYSYLAQAGILTGFVLAGLVVGQLISGAIAVSKIGISDLSAKEMMNKLLVPENANLVRLMQFVGVLFLFFIPTVVYARICHRKAWQHLGMKKELDIYQLILAVLLIFSAVPLVAALREITLNLPLGSYIKNEIVQSQAQYMKQATVLGTMRSFNEYFIALLVMAVLPGFFEEIFFRGALQNLFTRWFKRPVAAITLTAFLFSLIHFEYADFIGRFFLGLVLGWVFYQTGNIWFNVLMHAAFNALSVTSLYLATKAGKLNTDAGDEKLSPYFVLGGAAVFGIAAYIFYRLNKKKYNRPGEEVLPDNYDDPDNPSWLKTGP